MLFRSARILPFFGTHADSTIFRYSLGQFFDTRTDSSSSRYSPGFYHFSVLRQIRPFSGTSRDNFLIVVRILRFPDTLLNSAVFRSHTESSIFRYSSGQIFETRSDSTFSRYSPGFYHFLVLTLILPVFGTPLDRFSILAWILPFPGTRPDSTIFRYSR